MVVIEPVPSTGDDIEPKPSNSTTTAKVDLSNNNDRANADGVDSSSGRNATAAAGYASDGYETANETEVGDDEAVLKDQTYEDALNEDELKQKILAQMKEAKDEGNKLFADGLYQEALMKYDYAIQLAPEMSSSAEIRSICHNNRATCLFKLGNYKDTIKECTKALELNPTYMKALLRRGEAHEKLTNYNEALDDMKKILELDPSNRQA